MQELLQCMEEKYAVSYLGCLRLCGGAVHAVPYNTLSLPVVRKRCHGSLETEGFRRSEGRLSGGTRGIGYYLQMKVFVRGHVVL